MGKNTLFAARGRTLPDLVGCRRWRSAGSTTAVADGCEFAVAGWSAVILDAAFLLVTAFEVGFVRAVALQTEACRQNQGLQLWLSTRRIVA